MTCKRCLADLQPTDFGSPRKCAFDERGYFTLANWNCATLNDIIRGQDWGHPNQHEGADESLNLFYLGEGFQWEGQSGGWIVLTRYKHRGRCSSAIRVGDFSPQPVTLAMAEAALAAAAPEGEG